jgi:hypothetical protein
VNPAIASFRDRHGRPPRVLHVGNIANNAYINAKLLIDAGFECDVICCDYYHIMGSPEWEDADIEGEVDDQFRPDWTRVDLGGFKRPEWFAQGPQALCLQYLTARVSGQSREADRLWKKLGDDNRTRLEVGGPGFLRPLLTWIRRSARRRPYLISRVLWKVQAAWRTFGRTGPRAFSDAWSEFAYLRRRYGMAGWFPASLFALVAMAGATIGDLAGRWSKAPKSGETSAFMDRVSDLTTRFAREFPERPDQLTVGDLASLVPWMPAWKRLLVHYDLVVAYSTEPVISLLAGVPYVACEHGTIRTIPYEDMPMGRRTALSYRLASHVLVTNIDCLPSAERLAPGRFTFINHPFDEDQGRGGAGWRPLRDRVCDELGAEFLFFFPTRQDWVPGKGSADKANDMFFRAFASLRRQGIAVGVVCCSWGFNVRQSKALIEELNCSRHVKWVAPMPTLRFQQMSRAAHCVVDQFVVGAFGGVVFKAMAVGAPVLTFLDESHLRRVYPEPPPIINCRTEDEIVAQVSRYARSLDELAVLGAAGRTWIERYHSKNETVARQLAVFETLLWGTQTTPAQPTTLVGER